MNISQLTHTHTHTKYQQLSNHKIIPSDGPRTII